MSCHSQQTNTVSLILFISNSTTGDKNSKESIKIEVKTFHFSDQKPGSLKENKTILGSDAVEN